MRMAFQGARGAYSEAAAERVQPGVDSVPCERFEDVFSAVRDGAVEYGILPIENSVGGSIHRNYDLLIEHDLPIVAEVELPVVHNLLALPGVPREAIRRVFSHPQALAQCERYVRTLPGVEVVATYDTAGSARLIRDGNLQDTAAIASARAAGIFDLAILQEGIQDFADNITRFIVVSREATPLGVPDKTSLAFTLQNAPGALFKALSVFALRDIDLTKLESRPARGLPWEYLFYADLAVGPGDARCERALAHLGEFARWVRVLGSYRRWTSAAPAGAGVATAG